MYRAVTLVASTRFKVYEQAFHLREARAAAVFRYSRLEMQFDLHQQSASWMNLRKNNYADRRSFTVTGFSA